MARPRVLSVGQCGFDHAKITGYLGLTFHAHVRGVDTAAEALDALRAEPFDLVLVNRVGDRDGASGLDLIRALKADPDLASVPVMLVSNYDDAQAQAVGLGALPGFGKSQLLAATTKDRLAGVLSAVESDG